MVISPFFVWSIKMVHLTNISKQHGSQILFKKASLQILTGARIGLVGANGTGKSTFLILDEPTNHLDIQSREILLAALKKFTGTLVLVSHDRHFLRCLVNRVFEIDQGKMTPYEGDYEYYLSKTGRDHRAI